MIESVTFHVFSDGAGFIDLGEGATPQDVEEFSTAWKSISAARKTDVFFVGDIRVVVVEHANPFRKTEIEIKE